MPDEPKLKPCPACGNQNVKRDNGGNYAFCSGSDTCGMQGPWGDPTGSKWNALPRRTDAPSGMSDGELIARAIVNGFATIAAMMGALKGHDMLTGLGDGPEQFAKSITDEFDRRAAARKEATK